MKTIGGGRSRKERHRIKQGRVAWRERAVGRIKKCQACGKGFTKDRPATVDHIIPLSKGGADHPDNYQLLCRMCNQRKSCKMPDKDYHGLKADIPRKRRK